MKYLISSEFICAIWLKLLQVFNDLIYVGNIITESDTVYKIKVGPAYLSVHFLMAVLEIIDTPNTSGLLLY